jgi:hypothetical protein
MARLGADDVRLAAAGPHAVGIWPAAHWLPANILRFYVQFSEPAEAVFDRVQLRLATATGALVPDAFLVLNEELWSPDGRRLTVLMEPGRIKRGMGPDSKHEPALVPGRSYLLEVGTGGRVLSKVFGVLPPVMEPLLETHWRVSPPPVGSRLALEVTFDRVMDNAIVTDEIQVQIQALTDDSRKLVFRPLSRWEEAEYHLVLSRRFEDVCGNRLGEALDHLLAARQRPRGGILTFHSPPVRCTSSDLICQVPPTVAANVHYAQPIAGGSCKCL